MKNNFSVESTAEQSSQSRRIEVLSTFVADPVVQTLRYWCDRFLFTAEFLPFDYGQLFPRLFKRDNKLDSVDFHVVLFAIRDLIPDKERQNLSDETPHANITEFIKALELGIKGSRGAWILICCPGPPAETLDGAFGLNEQAVFVANKVKRLEKAVYIDASDPRTIHGNDLYFDEITDKHGHIPYTESFYTAIGTLVFRTIRERLGNVYKLIVTDCDGTLWDGVCGEVQPNKLLIHPHHQWLHRFLVDKKNAGMLLTICSQNNADDVIEVFDSRQDIRLSIDDFTRLKINWLNKVENIQALAQELNIALESVIFLDNDPVQRNKVKTSLPQILVPKLPVSSIDWPLYLQHVWAFDRFWITEESSRRHTFYQEHTSRENLRSDSESLLEFLEELDLKVSIREAAETDIPRLLELVNRVTQFNINNIKPSESRIRESVQAKENSWLVVRVEDRFGDYGLVGAMSYRNEGNYCRIKSFLLSCRALGRGVEIQMLQAIWDRAKSSHAKAMIFSVAETQRNTPAIIFLTKLGMSTSEMQAGYFQLDAVSVMSQLDNDRLLDSEIPTNEIRSIEHGARAETNKTSEPLPAEVEQILAAATVTMRPDALLNEIKSAHLRQTPRSDKKRCPPATTLERRIAEIFQDLLGHDDFDINEEFFDAGGHSLLVMRLLSRIKKDFDVDLPIRLLFTERLTISNLAKIVESSSSVEESSAELDTIKKALDTFSDEEIAALFSDIEPANNH